MRGDEVETAIHCPKFRSKKTTKKTKVVQKEPSPKTKTKNIFDLTIQVPYANIKLCFITQNQ